MLTIPLVVLLDIDGTLIGDITPQVIMYELKQRAKLPYNNKLLQEKLRNGIIRPNFKLFFNDLRAHGIEFFIYTSSEKKWAEHIVKQIELSSDVKFNRPIFARNYCHVVNGDYKKSISAVKPAIIKTLKKKYDGINSNSLKNMIMAIDNNTVYEGGDKKNLLLCDTYNYSIPENLPLTINKNVFEKNHSTVMNILLAYFPKLKVTSNYMKFEKQFYTEYVNTLSNTLKEKQHSVYDILFKTIRNFIIGKNISTFNENVVQYLNNKLQSNKNGGCAKTRSFF